MLSNIGFIATGRPLITPNERVAEIERYEVLVAPTVYPLTVDEVKEWLKIPAAQTADDVIIQTLIETATTMFQDYTNYILINTTFRKFNDCFAQSMEYTRGPLQSLESFEYLVEGVWTTVPTTYQLLNESFYWRIIFSEYQDIPNNKDDGQMPYQTIRTDFVAGLGVESSTIPKDIIIALQNHIAAMYENRGDCTLGDCSGCTSLPGVPAFTQTIYNKYRVQTAFGAKYRGV